MATASKKKSKRGASKTKVANATGDLLTSDKTAPAKKTRKRKTTVKKSATRKTASRKKSKTAQVNSVKAAIKASRKKSATSAESKISTAPASKKNKKSDPVLPGIAPASSADSHLQALEKPAENSDSFFSILHSAKKEKSKINAELDFSFSDLAQAIKPDVSEKSSPKNKPAKFSAEFISQEDIMINEKLQELASRSTAVSDITCEPQKVSPLENISDPIAAKYDVRNISSLELTLLGNELFAAGRINREELAMLAFQPELNKNYDLVGAQIDCKPDPNKPKNAIADWTEVLNNQIEFQCSPYFIAQTRRVIEILSSLDAARFGEE